MKFSRFLTSASLAAMVAVSAPAVAHADAIDNALAKLPAGQISCDQASRYWTNVADYNAKVAQARTLAMVDPRGPQILAALGRVDEAATRCGLKAGTAPASGGAVATAGGNTNAPAPAAPGLPVIELIPNAPVAQRIVLPNVGVVAIPDLWQMLRNWLAGFGIRI